MTSKRSARFSHARTSRLGPRTSGATALCFPSPKAMKARSRPGLRRWCRRGGWARSWARATSTSRTTPSAFPRFPSRTAWSLLLWPRRGDSVSRWLAARRRAIWRTPWPRRPRAKGSMRGFLFPLTSNPRKSPGTQVFGAKLVRIAGNYDQVNRLCSQIAEKFQWGFVNVNLRPVLLGRLENRGLRNRRAARLAPAR